MEPEARQGAGIWISGTRVSTSSSWEVTRLQLEDDLYADVPAHYELLHRTDHEDVWAAFVPQGQVVMLHSSEDDSGEPLTVPAGIDDPDGWPAIGTLGGRVRTTYTYCMPEPPVGGPNWPEGPAGPDR